MLSPNNVTQRIFLEQEYYLPGLVQSFLTDRKAGGLAASSVDYYREKLFMFLAYCEAQAVKEF